MRAESSVAEALRGIAGPEGRAIVRGARFPAERAALVCAIDIFRAWADRCALWPTRERVESKGRSSRSVGGMASLRQGSNPVGWARVPPVERSDRASCRSVRFALRRYWRSFDYAKAPAGRMRSRILPPWNRPMVGSCDATQKTGEHAHRGDRVI
jgi:hypothetical protein